MRFTKHLQGQGMSRSQESPDLANPLPQAVRERSRGECQTPSICDIHLDRVEAAALLPPS